MKNEISQKSRKSIAFFEKMWYNDDNWLYRQARSFVVQKERDHSMLEIIREFLTPLAQLLGKLLLTAFPAINALFIFGAGCLGSLLCKRLKPTVREIMIRCVGLAVVLLGVSEIWDCLFVLEGGQLEIAGTMLVVFSLAVGLLFGYALDIDGALGKLGLFLRNIFLGTSSAKKPAAGKAKKEELPPELLAAEILDRKNCAEGFTMAVVLCGFSSLLITNFLTGRMNDDPVPLLIKLAIDFVLVFCLTSIYGTGVPFAGIVVLISEGLFGIAYSKWGDILTPEILDQTALVGAVILLICGISLCTGKKLRPANLIPALFIPVIYTVLMTKVEESVKEKEDK